MKKQISYFIVATLSVGLFFSSCKKSENPATTDEVTEYEVQSDDQAQFSNETDASDNDVNAALENNGGTYSGERPLTPPLLVACDATVTVDTLNFSKKITITYSGNCIGKRSRSGSVIISFSPDFKWGTAGSQYIITYQNLKIKRKSDDKNIIINGTKTVTNVSGGRLRNLSTRLGPVVHVIIGATMVTFDDRNVRSWQIAKRKSFTYENGVVMSVSGISSLGGGIAEWGTNRFDKSFTSAIIEPLVIKQSCDFRLVSGKIKHTGTVVSTTTTFGLDANGSQVSTCPNGSFYYKVDWTGVNGNTHSHIGAY